MHTEIHGKKIPINGSAVGDRWTGYVLGSRIFVDWKDSLDRRFKVSSLEIQTVDFRGGIHSAETVMFVRLLVTEQDSAFQKVVQLRGGTVVILPVFLCEGAEYTVVIRQPRIATGHYDLAEVPAGMIDGGTFGGAAARELEEELGLTFREEELVELTNGEGIYLSCGLLDESARFYLAERTVDSNFLEDLHGRTTGVAEEGETITVNVVDIIKLSDLSGIRDGKALIAYALYQLHKQKREGERCANR